MTCRLENNKTTEDNKILKHQNLKERLVDTKTRRQQDQKAKHGLQDKKTTRSVLKPEEKSKDNKHKRLPEQKTTR